MSFSYVSHLYCPKCERTYDVDQIHQLCECGSPLLVAYDLEAMRQKVKRDVLREREANLWRYHELLPVKHPEHIVSLGEGMTPLVPMPRLGREIGIEALYMKDEGVIPTGTFKAAARRLGFLKQRNWASNSSRCRQTATQGRHGRYTRRGRAFRRQSSCRLRRRN